MNTRRATTRSARPPRAPGPGPAPAFTLLEVIIEITILGLGILGLAAVFAGSARQQVDSSRTGEALALASSFEHTVRSRFGPVTVSEPPQTLTVAQGQYAQADVPLRPGEWFPLSSYPDQPNRPVDVIAIDPSATPQNSALSVYFLVDGPRDTVLFHNPMNPRDGFPRYGGNQALGNVANAATFSQDLGQSASFYFENGAPLIRDLPHGRIHPGSLRIRFDIAKRERNPFDLTQWRVASRRSVYFTDTTYTNDGDTTDNPGGFIDTGFDEADFPRADDGKLRVLFNRTLVRVPNEPPTAFIERFQPAVGVTNYLSNAANNQEWIERIVVESYLWRNDALASVGDRVRRRADGSVLAVAPLLQRSESGAWRLAMFVYHARATRPAPTNVYVPPESGPVDNRVLRAFDVGLHYDSASQRWYFQLNTGEQRRYLAPGRIALVNDDALGADEFVQIARVTNNRAYLDRPPSAGGAAVLPPPPTGNPPPLNVRVWCLNDNVGSLEGNSDWEIIPVLGRVVSLR